MNVSSRFWMLILCLIGLVLLPPNEPSLGQGQRKVYLPLVTTPAQTTIFGAEPSRLNSDLLTSQLSRLNPSWVRLNGLHWSDIEATQGTYNWQAASLKQLETELLNTSKMSAQAIVIVQRSPLWAVAPHSVDCAPINPQAYDDYARFLVEFLNIYTKHPFNVRYLELGNEPDAFLFPDNSIFGCWGVTNDEYYGGGAYGEMLKVVYPAIKAAHPQIQVMFGGLLLDKAFDPNNPEATRVGRFLEGALRVGAGNAFDILAFHAYPDYGLNPDGNWADVEWKPAYLRGVMQRYNVDKPLFNTEGALLCRTVTEECRLGQAYFIPRLYARALRDSLMGMIWYTFDSDGFHNTSLVNPSNPQEVRPAFHAYRTARFQMGSATYVGPMSGLPPGSEGYLFNVGNRRLAVVWTNEVNGVNANIPIGSDVTCTAWDGAAKTCTPNGSVLPIRLELGATYISWRP